MLAVGKALFFGSADEADVRRLEFGFDLAEQTQTSRTCGVHFIGAQLRKSADEMH